MISQKENSTGYKMIPVGQQEDYASVISKISPDSFITTDVYDASYGWYELKYMRGCIKELRDMVYELRDMIDSKVVIIDSCEEMYAEEWRET